MVDVERTFTVNQPVEVVHNYLKDFGHACDWDPGTVSCTRLDDGPVRVGSHWRNVSELRGRTTELAYRLERLESQRLTFVGKNKTATSTDDITLTPVGETTSVTYHAHIVFHGIAKLADPFFKRVFEKLADETVEGITREVAALRR
ncbi:MAG: SRPBCC family protein [Mycobacteriales bacterium]